MTDCAVIYARFSSSKQREESIEDQVRVCREYAEKHGLKVVKVFKDEGRSGTNVDHRPGFLRMIAESKRGLWSKVIIYKMDRFARSRYDSVVYKEKLKAAGVKVVAAAEPIPDGPWGEFFEAISEINAAQYSVNLSENVTRGMEGNALKLKHNGNRIFGYECGTDGYYHVDEHEAEAVRMIFALCGEGKTKADIARKLNSLGYRTPRGKEFSIEAISRALKTEAYIGTYKWGSVRKEDGMPAIVSRDVWDEAHARMAARGRKRRGRMNADYLLSGKVFDEAGNQFESDCGRGENGTTYYYYRCRKTRKAFRRQDLEWKVTESCAQLLTENPGIDERIADIVLYRQDTERSDESAALEALRAHISDVEKEIDRAIDLALKTGASDAVAAKIKSLEAEKADLKAELAAMESEAPAITREMVLFLLYKMRKCEGPRKIIGAFVDRVTVMDDNSLLVQFILRKPSTCENKKPELLEEEFGNNCCGSPNLSLSELLHVAKNTTVLPIPGGFGILFAA